MKMLFRNIICCFLLLQFGVLQAQQNIRDSTRFRKDSTRMRKDTTGFRNDSARSGRGGVAALFADTAKLTSSDYQLQIEKTFVLLDEVESGSQTGLRVLNVKKRLEGSDSLLAILKDNINNNRTTLSLRNLQVFRSILENLQGTLKDQHQVLDSAEASLEKLRDKMKPLVGDTMLQSLMRDSALREQFAPQVREMRRAFRGATRQLRKSFADLNLLQTHNSSSSITASQLLEKVENQLSSSAARIFGKEFGFLWQKHKTGPDTVAETSIKKAYRAEQKAVRYYFRDSSNRRLFLLLIGFLFFIWVFRNIRTLKKLDAIAALKDLHFSYLPSGYVVSSLVVMFCIAPFFDLHAPSTYIETMQFFLIIILTIVCWKKWPRNLFTTWMAMVVLYILFSLSHHVVDPDLWQRWALVALNILSVVFGIRFLKKMKDNLHLRGFLHFVIVLHNVMNILSLVLNVFGRYTLAQLLGTTAIFAFMQAIGLAVFGKICIEAILLQVSTSRIKRGLTVDFDYSEMLISFRRVILVVTIVLWLIVFITNLNIASVVYNGLSDFLLEPRHIGDASFTLGGVLLFFAIIWLAHILQRYVGYFFGDAQGDEEVQNKRQRSRLLIAKLVLLSMGYLLAVAASGVPVDKITIVLGALGVGIGLGLQNIVHNFVSGIILIFDRPLQIGDIVQVGNHAGRVREIGLRSSMLTTKDGAEVIIPNGDILSGQIVNWTLMNNQRRITTELDVRGSDDMEQVATVIKNSIAASEYIVKEREPQILFTKVHEDGFSLNLVYWCVDVAKSEEARNEIFSLLKKGLEKNNLKLE